MIKQCFLAFAIFMLAGVICFARVDVTQTRKMILPDTRDAEIVSKNFTDRVLPKNIQEGQNGHTVLSQMADNTVAYWWETTPLRDTAIGQAADKIEKKARLKGEIQGSNQVTHFFDLKVLVMQALAKFEYKGWFHAGVNYDARAVATEAEIVQPLAKNQDLVVSQEFKPTESTSRLSFKFNW